MKKMEEKNKDKISLGTIGEKLALDFLSKNQYKILTQNYRVGKLGEVDIIAQESEYTCFIEVKTRTSTLYGMPSEAVTMRKQRHIIKMAYVYLNRHRLHDINVRFDIVEIIINKKIDSFEVKYINLIKNAFTL